MTSINTNLAAVSALRTLQQTNTALDATQNRISTGLKIGEAKDNAAYWSISTTLKSDNKAMATVKDALSLGAATVDIAYQGLTASVEVLNEIKAKLVAASQAGVDQDAVQAEIKALQDQLTSIANSSNFSGENWLNDRGGEKEVVSSFTRGTGNALTIGTIKIQTDDVALIDGAAGILDTVATKSVTGSEKTSDVTTWVAPTLDADDTVKFTVTQGTGSPIEVTIDRTLVNEALGTTTAGAIASRADLVTVLNAAFAKAKINDLAVSLNGAGNTLTFKSSQTFTFGPINADDAGTANANLTAANMGLGAGASTTASPITASVLTLDVSGATKSEIEAMISIVGTATDKVTAQAANLGAVSSRIELQQTFVQNLMDTIEKGVSGLIDADMNEESTKLQALQVKQQLGVQALSIANQSAQNVLSLFQ